MAKSGDRMGTNSKHRTSSKTYPGVRWRSHPERKHGAVPDRYFMIRYQHQGRRKEEGLGWASEGWTERKAALELAKLREAARLGEGPTRLAEKRQIAQAKRLAAIEAQEQEERDALTFDEFWHQTYFPQAQKDKTPGSWQREDQLYRLWLEPVIGQRPLKDIGPLHLERVKKNMAEAGRAPRSIQYCLAVARQVFNQARKLGLFRDEAPTSMVKKPNPDNQRLRFLTQAEAKALLEDLAAASPDLHDMALLSLHTGMRSGEIRSLAWGDVDLEQKMITMRDTKNGRTRHVPLTGPATDMLAARRDGQKPSALAFPGQHGQRRVPFCKAFRSAISRLGLNEGVTDRRQRVTFHSLRHTYASWLVMQGTPLYTVQRLMGHRTSAMTERYSHLAPDHLRQAVKGFEDALAQNDAQANMAELVQVNHD